MTTVHITRGVDLTSLHGQPVTVIRSTTHDADGHPGNHTLRQDLVLVDSWHDPDLRHHMCLIGQDAKGRVPIGAEYGASRIELARTTEETPR